jgi:hypothetical protein
MENELCKGIINYLIDLNDGDDFVFDTPIHLSNSDDGEYGFLKSIKRLTQEQMQIAAQSYSERIRGKECYYLQFLDIEGKIIKTKWLPTRIFACILDAINEIL